MVKKQSLWIFGASIVMALILIALERKIGIGWNYHPDAATYVIHTTLLLLILLIQMAEIY